MMTVTSVKRAEWWWDEGRLVGQGGGNLGAAAQQESLTASWPTASFATLIMAAEMKRGTSRQNWTTHLQVQCPRHVQKSHHIHYFSYFQK